MELAGSEINQKMRSAIKAKLTELGCYVDDELPDYVMVMVANKRTRSQMEDDLQLFLGGNTQLFVNWLHQVLKKLQEVSINTAPPNPPLNEDAKAAKSSSKEREKDKVKEKKDKKVSKEKDKHHKKSLRTIGSTKKSKKEAKKKEKARKKITRTHKSKKKSTDEMIRPNVPPLLMNLEKESEPSITDVFAGQILKNHGITLEQNSRMETKIDDVKPLRKALKRNRFPIIDPATVSNITEENSATTATVLLSETISVANSIESTSNDANELTPAVAHKTNINITSDLESLPINIKTNEINEIEAKIQGLKKKLADQLDSMSEDEDFLNIRTEAEELMNDLADDVLQEITATQNATSTPPLSSKPAPTANKPTPKTAKPTSKPAPARPEQDVLPVIELQLPKRPMRERLGVRPEREKRRSVERLTPEKEPQIDERSTSSVRSRLGETVEQNRKRHTSPRDDSQEKREETSSRRLLSKVSVLEVQRHGEERTARAGPASVVRVRPRPRLTVGAPAPSLLMRAVADAHKSLLSVPPKVDPEQSSVKKALVLPMRRNMDAQKIVIQVQSDRIPSPEHSDCEIDFDTESLADLESDVDKNSNEYVPDLIGKNSSHSAKYVPSHTSDSSIVDEETIKIHNPTVGGEKGPQFVVTLDGLDPNVFLAQKLKTEGITDEDLVLKSKKTTLEEQIKPTSTECNNISETKDNERRTVESNKSDSNSKPKDNNNVSIDSSSKNEPKHITTPKKTKTPTKSTSKALEKMSPENDSKATDSSNIIVKKESSPPAVKKRRASPIVFDVAVRERERSEKREKRERKESAGSDITVTTTASTHKYDSLPSLPPEKRKLPCRMFPACRFGADCAFSHPPCKFHSSCSRRDCIYSHPPATALVHAPQPVVASHVVPVSNYKCITPTALPSVCKFYPSCANPACHFLHPKPCRYGKACINKLECNFYHHEVNTNTKWRSPFKV